MTDLSRPDRRYPGQEDAKGLDPEAERVVPGPGEKGGLDRHRRGPLYLGAGNRTRDPDLPVTERIAMERLLGFVRAYWWAVGLLLFAAVAAITLSVARTPADRFEVWKLILDKGALALLIATAGMVLQMALEKAKAAEVWATEIARERIAVGRQLWKHAQDVMQHHAGFRIAQQYGRQQDELAALRAWTSAARELASVGVDAAMFFDEPLALAFEKVSARSTAFLERSGTYANAVKIESRELHQLFQEAEKALRERITPAKPGREPSRTSTPSRSS